jgi:hypothetical protein
METTSLYELYLEISAEGVSAEDLDQMTREFLSELKDTEVESVSLAAGDPVPSGAKAVDPVATGALIMSVLPAVLPKIIDLVQAWMDRGKGRVVKFKGKVGREEIEFEGPPEELKKVLAHLGGVRRG